MRFFNFADTGINTWLMADIKLEITSQEIKEELLTPDTPPGVLLPITPPPPPVMSLSGKKSRLSLKRKKISAQKPVWIPVEITPMNAAPSSGHENEDRTVNIFKEHNYMSSQSDPAAIPRLAMAIDQAVDDTKMSSDEVGGAHDSRPHDIAWLLAHVRSAIDDGRLQGD